MKRKVLAVMLALMVTGSAWSVTRQKSEPEFKLVEFQMALLKRAPQDQRPLNTDLSDLHSQHLAYIQSLLESGKAVIAGPLAGDGEIRGVSIFRTKSTDEARGWAENDPLVKAGHLIVEMHPWWSEEVMKKPALPLKMTTAYLGFLVRGAQWTPEKTPQTEELQKAHLANINRLAEMKKLVVAGPFGDNGELRGIFVFKVASLDEAKVLAETDPAVRAGRLKIIMHTWSVPEGVLP
ncbi:MAG TPA: YciI family protein [Pyrinomonadaceae bacterium]|nr:YciI family protein [Pyrinomonadaceae bacterium]